MIIVVILFMAHLDIYPTINRIIVTSHWFSIIPFPCRSGIPPVVTIYGNTLTLWDLVVS